MTAETKPVYLDPSRSISERVQDLISRLTLQEKISQMRNGASAILRLNIPAYDFWSEALHGVARNGRATIFPQAIGMAATWDPALIEQIASAIGDEGRAKYHEALRKQGRNRLYQGLTFWSPNINIFRDPRWGRGQETWGEDPYLTGEMGSAFVRGIQGDHPKYLKAAACAKHYAVHSGPERDRHTFNADVSKRDLHSTYLPAFKKLVQEAKVEAVMGAYNRTLDEPCCASQLLLGDILRGAWGFEGHVVSDCGALSDIHLNHKYTRDGAETAGLALERGCDIGCDCVYYDYLQEALERGLITEEMIDRSLLRTIGTRFKLGMFDPDDQVPYASIPMDVVGSVKHRQLAYEAAIRSVVLLKNRNNILPVKDSVKSVLVVGPTAATLDVLLGNYYGINDTMTTLLEGIIHTAPEGLQLEYRPGCLLTEPTKNPVEYSIYQAATADLTIACMGITPLLEGEEGDAALSDQNGDRLKLGLPANQVEYIKNLAAAGAKIVLVLTGGSPITLGELEEMVEAVVFVWYPGQEGGRAVADILFGKKSPSGKLPITFPKSVEQLPPFEDYNMADRTYRFASWEPLYPFGFGLSYTSFVFKDLRLGRQSIQAGESLEISFTIENTGPVDGEEVAQIYLSDLESSVPVPHNSLIAFQRIALKAGESQDINITIQPDAMLLVDDEGEMRLEPGLFMVTAGSSSPGQRSIDLGAPLPLTATFDVLD